MPTGRLLFVWPVVIRGRHFLLLSPDFRTLLAERLRLGRVTAVADFSATVYQEIPCNPHEEETLP